MNSYWITILTKWLACHLATIFDGCRLDKKKIAKWQANHFVLTSKNSIIKPRARSRRLVSWNCFCSLVSMCVCVSALKGINNHWRDLVIGHVWLVKQSLRLFRILPSINWKGMALVTQHIVHARQRCQSWCHTSNRKRHVNYLE